MIMILQGDAGDYSRHAPGPPPRGSYRRTTCRICDSDDLREFISLGEMSLANAFLSGADLRKPEPRFPLSAHYCGQCGLVQVLDVVDPSLLFSHYAYLSSASQPLVAHFARVAEDIHATYLADPNQLTVEIGSNDGIFLKNLVGKSRCVGIDPAKNISEIAAKNGITTVQRFFNYHAAAGVRDLYGRAKVIFAANSLSHIDDLSGVMEGVSTLLDSDGVLIFENHRFANMLRCKGFDQIYHEHLCYFTFGALEYLLARFDMRIFDARIVPIHGESYQIHAARDGSAYKERPSVARVRSEEIALELDNPRTYVKFAVEINKLKTNLMGLLKNLKAKGMRIVGYGAPAKGNILMNFCGIDPAMLDYIIDTSPTKQGRYSPGSHIPILPPDVLYADAPDYVLLLAWNYADAILRKEKPLRDRGVKFIVPVPKLEIV